MEELVNYWPAGTLESLTILCREEDENFFPATATPGDDFEDDLRIVPGDDHEDWDSLIALFSNKELNEVELLEEDGRDAPAAAAFPDKADKALGVFRAPFGKCSDA